MLPVDYGYLHNSIYIVILAVISAFRAGFGRFRPVSLGFVKKTHPKTDHFLIQRKSVSPDKLVYQMADMEH